VFLVTSVRLWASAVAAIKLSRTDKRKRLRSFAAETGRFCETLVGVEAQEILRPCQAGVGDMKDVERAVSARCGVRGGEPAGFGDDFGERDFAELPETVGVIFGEGFETLRSASGGQ